MAKAMIGDIVRMKKDCKKCGGDCCKDNPDNYYFKKDDICTITKIENGAYMARFNHVPNCPEYCIGDADDDEADDFEVINTFGTHREKMKDLLTLKRVGNHVYVNIGWYPIATIIEMGEKNWVVVEMQGSRGIISSHKATLEIALDFMINYFTDD